MATVSICDRCGRKISLCNTKRYSFTKLIFVGYISLCDDETTKYDLCSECCKKLDDFFDGKSIEPIEKE